MTSQQAALTRNESAAETESGRDTPLLSNFVAGRWVESQGTDRPVRMAALELASDAVEWVLGGAAWACGTALRPQPSSSRGRCRTAGGSCSLNSKFE